MNQLNYGFDVTVNYGQLFKAEYEKANIWPIKDADEGVEILLEEIDEAAKAVDALVEFVRLVPIDRGFFFDKTEAGEMRAFAASAICELLQVIAVCNKYEDVFAEALEEVDTNGVEITK